MNLHDFYAGLERIFQRIDAVVDGQIPTGSHWRLTLLRQMQADVENLRPPVLSAKTVQLLDEFLRFRHVVRNIYAFQFEPEQIERLVAQLRPAFEQAQEELLLFASFLERVGKG